MVVGNDNRECKMNDDCVNAHVHDCIEKMYKCFECENVSHATDI